MSTLQIRIRLEFLHQSNIIRDRPKPVTAVIETEIETGTEAEISVN